MIISNLQNSSRVESLHPLFKKLFDYVKTHDLLHTECGRIELDGDNLFINNSNPTCVTADQQVLEVHRDTLMYIFFWKDRKPSDGKLWKI